MQTAPHLRGPLPQHLQGIKIPFRPVINLQADPAASPPSPSRRLLTPPLMPDPSADSVLPSRAYWWEYASERLSGSNLKGTNEPAYEMSMTEVLGHIRYEMDGPWVPVIANLTCICPCYMSHGGDCEASPLTRCHSIPEFHEVCFKLMSKVSVYSFLHASIAANCPVRVGLPWEGALHDQLLVLATMSSGKCLPP